MATPKFDSEILANEHGWTPNDIGSNSISGVLSLQESGSILQMPNFGQKGLNRMDSIQPVIAQIPKRVLTREFDPYLKSIVNVIDKYQLTKALGDSALQGIPVLKSVGDESDEDDDFKELSRLLSLKEAHSMDRLNRTRMLSSTPKNWSQIPKVFTAPDYDLKNPKILAEAVESKDIVANAEDYRYLKDKFTGYRDTIEIKLLQEISRRSNSFFGALTNLQQLEEETDACLKKIEDLRNSLGKIRETNIKRGLQVIRVKQQRSYSAMLYGVIKMVSHAKQSQPIINELLSQSDYVGALDLLQEASAFLKENDAKEDKSSKVVISEGITILKNQPIMPRDFDFHRIQSVSHLSTQLAQISYSISSIMESEFTGFLLKDLELQLDAISSTPYSATNIPSKTLIGIASNSIRNILSETYSFTTAQQPSSTTLLEKPEMPALSAQDASLKATLKPLIYGLLRMDKLDHALLSYKETLFKQLKTVSKQKYPKISDPPVTISLDKNLLKNYERDELAAQLKQMSFDSFFSTLIKIYLFFLRALQRATIVNEIILSIINEAQKDGIEIGVGKIQAFELIPDISASQALKASSMDSIGNIQLDAPLSNSIESIPFSLDTSPSGLKRFNQVTHEANNILYAATDLAHIRCAKFIAVRQDQNSRLNPNDFYRLFNATWEFLTAGEQLCCKMCFGLKGSILSQAKSFLNYFHEEKTKQIALLLDNEQWFQADIPIDFQQLVEQITTLAPKLVKEPPTSQRKKNEHPLSHTIDQDDDEMDMAYLSRFSANSRESLDGIGTETISTKYLTVDGARYYTVVTVLMFLKSLMDYVQCAKNIPSLTPDILAKIFEFLKLFNSRTCQLILGSAALRSAGLESITAKHISLCAQSLGLVMGIMPYIRSGILQYLNPRQQDQLSGFDKIIGDFRNHQNELYMHLVSIMMERLNTHSLHLVAINWDTPDQKDFGTDGISVTMSSLVKETCALYKVISKYLPPESVRSVMTEVFRSYVKRLEEDLRNIDLFSSAGKNRILNDAHHFTETLSTLDGIEGPGSQLEVVVNNIRIKDKRTYQQPKVQNISAPPAPAQPPKTGYFGKILK